MEIEVQTAVDVNICLYGGLKWAGYRKPRSVGVILKDYVGAWQSKGPSEYKGGEGVYLDPRPNRDNIIYCWPQI